MTDLEKTIACFSQLPPTNGQYTNWVRCVVVVWKPYTDKDGNVLDIVQVHRLLVYELPNRDGTWTGRFNFSEEYEGFNAGKWRVGGGYPDRKPSQFDGRVKFWSEHPKKIEVKVILDNPLVSLQ